MDTNAWVEALDKFWGNQAPGSFALLMLERSQLPHIAELIGSEFDSPEEAEIDFLKVANGYLCAKANRPWYPEPFYANHPPRFLLQIAVQVYAASKMADDPDGEHTSAAYYVQLQNLVGEYGARERFNSNDQGDYHQVLWRERLAEWAKARELRLDLPEDHSGAGRHVQLPKSQTAFRVGDLARLPLFFHKYGFEPIASEVEKADSQVNRIGNQLFRQRHDSVCFSSWAQRVLDDKRKFPIAKAQVEYAYKVWDGRLALRDPARGSYVKSERTHWIWLDMRLPQRQLRAVGGTSAAIAKGMILDDFAALLSGKKINDRYRLEFHDGLALFSYESEDAAFKQAEYIDAGNRGILLAGPEQPVNWHHILNCDRVAFIEEQFSSEDEAEWQMLNGLPLGCRAVVFRVYDSLPDAEFIPETWHPFLRLPPARLSLSGGLRIGRKEHFIAGAGPQLMISGKVMPRFLFVDGQKVRIHSRTVQLPQFSLEGDHEIVARIDGKTTTKRFRVSHPKNVLPRDMPHQGWQLYGDKWPTWDSTLSRESEKEPSADESKPRIFGIRGVGLGMTDQKKSEPVDNCATAIRLLAGMPLRERPTSASDHPLVRQLLMQSDER